MNPAKPAQQHADAVHSDAFTGNLQRASLLPGEIAVRPPISQDIRAAAGTMPYSEPAGAGIYRRLQRRSGQERSHITSGRERPWWHWPTIVTTVVVAIWMAVAGHS
ncbi:MAG TPA: hypothetical protein VGH38_17500 [Bryobacteraceae bacterium]|jgi:hypothetical protein